MSKRKLDEISEDPTQWKPPTKPIIQNSLDSDEEDAEVNEDRYNVMNEEDFEGIDDEPLTADVGYTAFNMKEELEEGHFDKDGHYIRNKEKEIKDNWLDNIDWVKIKPPAAGTKGSTSDTNAKGLADSDSEEEFDIRFDPIPMYKEILEYLQAGETVSKALCRLGKGKKRMTTAERWKKKKENAAQAGSGAAVDTNDNSEKIIKLTELANDLLARTGNMDIYQESYESIKKKVERGDKKDAELDMYADDFDTKEKSKLVDGDTAGGAANSTAPEEAKKEEEPEEDTSVTWELKWSQNEGAEVNGPHTTEQMHAWAQEGYFKSGAWVRRTGQQGQFYSAARVDFELYL